MLFIEIGSIIDNISIFRSMGSTLWSCLKAPEESLLNNCITHNLSLLMEKMLDAAHCLGSLTLSKWKS